MPIPQSARFALFLRRMFTIRETMGDINVLQDLFPTAELAGDVMPDLRRFRDEHQFFIAASANTANQIPRLLFSVQTVNTVCVIRHLLLNYNITDNIQIGWTSAVNFDHNGGQMDGRDSRGTTTKSQILAANNLTGVVTTPFAIFPVSSGLTFTLQNVDWVLTNKDTTGAQKGIEISGSGVSATPILFALAWGYERPVEPHEQLFS